MRSYAGDEHDLYADDIVHRHLVVPAIEIDDVAYDVRIDHTVVGANESVAGVNESVVGANESVAGVNGSVVAANERPVVLARGSGVTHESRRTVVYPWRCGVEC